NLKDEGNLNQAARSFGQPRRNKMSSREANAAPGDTYLVPQKPEYLILYTQISAFIERSDFIVTIKKQGWSSFAFAEAELSRLGPTRMIHCWIDIGKKAILLRRESIPKGRGLFGCQGDALNCLGALETIFPGYHYSERSTVLF